MEFVKIAQLIPIVVLWTPWPATPSVTFAFLQSYPKAYPNQPPSYSPHLSILHEAPFCHYCLFIERLITELQKHLEVGVSALSH